MTDPAEIVRNYFQWKAEQEAEADPTGPEAYAHSLEIQKELRILRALRVFLANYDDVDEAYIRVALSGDEETLEEMLSNEN